MVFDLRGWLAPGGGADGGGGGSSSEWKDETMRNSFQQSRYVAYELYFVSQGIFESIEWGQKCTEKVTTV